MLGRRGGDTSPVRRSTRNFSSRRANQGGLCVELGREIVSKLKSSRRWQRVLASQGSKLERHFQIA